MEVSLEYTDHTEVRQLTSDTRLADIQPGARIEAGTLLTGDDQTMRHAYWVTVNGIYTHGDVLEVDNALRTLVLQQAHGGTVRTLHVSDKSTFRGKSGVIDRNHVSTLIGAGQHVFFTAYTHTSALDCPDATVVVLNGPW